MANNVLSNHYFTESSLLSNGLLLDVCISTVFLCVLICVCATAVRREAIAKQGRLRKVMIGQHIVRDQSTLVVDVTARRYDATKHHTVVDVTTRHNTP